MREIKRTLDAKVVEYPAEPLLLEPGVRAVLLYRIDEAEVVAGGRMTLAPGTLSVGYFWRDRPYNVYHWLYDGKTLIDYINIGRFVSLSDEALVWDDYAVDILAYPDGSVEVIDEDEIPANVDAYTREFIRQATATVVDDVEAIIGAANAETASLLEAHGVVVQR
jgi:predicted RNA-binding protein associated with RNAse of E/G family